MLRRVRVENGMVEVYLRLIRASHHLKVYPLLPACWQKPLACATACQKLGWGTLCLQICAYLHAAYTGEDPEIIYTREWNVDTPLR
jgi:hypothetical protein